MERFKGVNELSIEAGDMEDLLKKNEYLDMKDFIGSVEEEEQKRKAEEERRNAQRRRQGRC